MRWVRWLWLTATLVSLGGCAGDDLYVMSERYELREGARVFAGGGCTLAIAQGIGSSGPVGSGGGTADGDFTEERVNDGNGLQVVVRSGSQELARRHYDRDFLTSGAVDRFQVTTLSGKVYELAYWGGEDCDTSHVPPET